MPGAVNTAADEFDAAFLSDNGEVVFSRSTDVDKDPVLNGHDRLKQRLNKALVNGERLERLVSEVLDVSRITAGRLSLELEELDLTALVAYLRQLPPARSTIPPPLPPAADDPDGDRFGFGYHGDWRQ